VVANEATPSLHGVEDEFRGASFRDTRLGERLVRLAAAMSETPDASFPRALPISAELEGAYRLFGNTNVRPGDVLEPHIKQTLSRIADQPEVLLAHDSSTVSFTSEGHREGLTPARGEKQSFMLHCSLAIRADGTRRPEGVLAASYHIPTDAKDGSLQERWSEHVLDVHGLGLAPDRVIHLMDREADDYEILALLKGIGGRFAIRVQHNRKLEDGRLREIAAEATLQAEREVPLSKRIGKAGPKQRKIHPKRRSRMAQLAICSTRVSIPKNPRARGSEREELELNLVRVWEPKPPENEPPVEWLLYTTEPIESAEQVLRIVDWYCARWTIEEFFKALKQGCALEKRQLGDLHGLTNATALFLPIAWKLLVLKSEDATRPFEPATTVLQDDELEVLRLLAKKPLPHVATTREALYAIAALGGHLKHNGPPGWQTLARGYERLRAVLEGYRLRHALETETARAVTGSDSPS
jgi:hypothetical protein